MATQSIAHRKSTQNPQCLPPGWKFYPGKGKKIQNKPRLNPNKPRQTVPAGRCAFNSSCPVPQAGERRGAVTGSERALFPLYFGCQNRKGGVLGWQLPPTLFFFFFPVPRLPANPLVQCPRGPFGAPSMSTKWWRRWAPCPGVGWGGGGGFWGRFAQHKGGRGPRRLHPRISLASRSTAARSPRPSALVPQPVPMASSSSSSRMELRRGAQRARSAGGR